jgi:uncharacterized protein (DUF885 family)
MLRSSNGSLKLDKNVGDLRGLNKKSGVVNDITDLVSSLEKARQLLQDVDNILSHLELKQNEDNIEVVQEVNTNAENFKSSLEKLISSYEQQLEKIEEALRR